MPNVTQTFQYTNGVDGRIRIHGNSNVVAGITKWDRDSTTAVTRLLNFESPADSVNHIVQPTKIPADGDNKVAISGLYNMDTTDGTEGTTTAISNGAIVALDLYGSKASSLGYPNVVGIVSNFKVTSQVGNNPLTFDCTVEVSGVFPAWGTIT